MPELDIHDIPAEQKTLMLENMLRGPAFALFLDRWNESVIGSIEKAIFDPATSDEKTRELKSMRLALGGVHHPRKIVETMLRSISAQTKTNK